MGAAYDIVPWGNVRGEELLERTKRANREALSRVILECKGLFVGAIGEIREALRTEGMISAEQKF